MKNKFIIIIFKFILSLFIVCLFKFKNNVNIDKSEIKTLKSKIKDMYLIRKCLIVIMEVKLFIMMKIIQFL